MGRRRLRIHAFVVSALAVSAIVAGLISCMPNERPSSYPEREPPETLSPPLEADGGSEREWQIGPPEVDALDPTDDAGSPRANEDAETWL